MATTTPNNGWPVPTSTDLVKDGATAIEALGDAIDATLGIYSAPALKLVKSQTIGSAVSSVNVTGAFSTTYKNYKIIVSGGASSVATGLSLALGATNTNYYSSRYYRTYAGSASSDSNNNTASWLLFGLIAPSGLSVNAELFNPFESAATSFNSQSVIMSTTGEMNVAGGYLNNTTSYTDFTLTPASGTLTGGIIRVYGYVV
jgi:hypothetical protein